MSHFEDYYSNISYPVAQEGLRGLRRAQLGAIHAIGAYFALPQAQPGIIVMPTGSGKTAVIALSGYITRAKRVLVLTPSRLVRAQIAEQLRSLEVLKRANVISKEFAPPKVKEAKNRVATDEIWRSFEEFDFIVSTPQCVSPGIKGVAIPPEGLFDLILMDEAHHSEAPRWSDILSHFQNTKRLLFTATPFRRDKKELKGTLLFSYPLRLAHEDKIFGNLRFVPVNPPEGLDHDQAIARQAETVFREDRAAGLNHRLMVRTDSKKKAEQLAAVYSTETGLKLDVVHSGHTLKGVRRTLDRLKAGHIDGIICVAMMGEGFDFPELKIAAIHSPHKSLAVTLQFIGRFARTTGDNLGEAKFIAVPKDIQAETDELYRESATWQDIVSNLSATRIEREIRVKKIAGTFEPIEVAETEIADVVLTDFRPYFHVKIYQLEDQPMLNQLPLFSKGVSILRHEVSDEHNSSLILLRQVTRPRWTDLPQFSRIENDLVVLYYDQNAKLLFISSSRRSLMFYKIFEDFYGSGLASLLSGPTINRVIADLQDLDCFSVGLKNSVQNSNTESYQIKTGPSAQNAISPSDGLLYQRGHLMGKGADPEGNSVTIGYSSSSKVWSNRSARVGELLEWCKHLAEKLLTEGIVVTGTPLDLLSIGEDVDKLPEGLIGVGWHQRVYKSWPRVSFIDGEERVEGQISDFDINIDRSGTTANSWMVRLENENGSIAVLEFTIENSRALYKEIENASEIKVIDNDEDIPLLDYLRHYPFSFYLEDFSRLDGTTLYRFHSDRELIETDRLSFLRWGDNGIDITVECSDNGLDTNNPKSIQDFLGATLLASDADIVFFDHGSGEIADFITFTARPDNRVEVGLYHCKGSDQTTPGSRVSEAYEVCGQVSKCLVWLKSKKDLRTKILDREYRRRHSSRFIKGQGGDLQRMLADDAAVKLEYKIYVVQPGLAVSNVNEKVGKILGAASYYVQRTSGGRMYAIGSQ